MRTEEEKEKRRVWKGRKIGKRMEDGYWEGGGEEEERKSILGKEDRLGKERKRREGEYSIRYNSICIIIYNI